VRQVGALVHAIVLRLGADVVSVLLHVGIIGRQRPAITSRPRKISGTYGKY
jgi:hypothetical protein